jgi:hypothetical protein
VLSKDPDRVTIDGFLDRELAGLEEFLEGSHGQAVEERGFLHDLVDRLFNRDSLGVGDRVQVQAHDGDTIRELFYITTQPINHPIIIYLYHTLSDLPTYFLVEYRS